MASQEHYFFLVAILRAKHGGIIVIYSQANIAFKEIHNVKIGKDTIAHHCLET